MTVRDIKALQPTGDRIHYRLDLELARHFNLEHSSEAQYCAERGEWITWNLNRWVFDQGAVEALMQKLARSRLNEAVNLPVDSPNRIALIRAASQAEMRRCRQAALADAAAYAVQVQATQFNENPILFNVMNGTVDLATGELRQHSRDDYITVVAPVKFDPDARCPRFMQYLRTTFCGKPDLIDFVRQFSGYCLTGKTDAQIMALFYGPTGTGKSQFAKIMLRILGEYAWQAPSDLLLCQGAANRVILRILHPFLGVASLCASRPPKGRRWTKCSSNN